LGKQLASRLGKLYNAGMRVIARKNLAAFWLDHPETEAPLRAWLAAANGAEWKSMTDIVATYSKASPINAERCVFNIHGNSYRLIVAIRFTKQLIFIKFIGTHSDYDNVDAATVSEF
jgi:mRNA interferase HigB